MTKLNIPMFGDIQFELLAKALAVTTCLPGPVADDIADTMKRASIIIGEARTALQEIKQLGVSEEGHLSRASMRADEALMLIQENTK